MILSNIDLNDRALFQFLYRLEALRLKGSDEVADAIAVAQRQLEQILSGEAYYESVRRHQG